MKKLALVITVLIFCILIVGQAQGQEDWRIKGAGGAVIPEQGKVEGHFKALIGHKAFKNLFVYGKYENVNVTNLNIDNYIAEITWFSSNPSLTAKPNLYLLTGAGAYHQKGETEFKSYGLGLGVRFPEVWGGLPLIELGTNNIDGKWYWMPVMGLEIAF